MLAPETQAFEQEIAEIGGVERLQPILIGGVEPAALAVGEGAGLARGDLGRAQTAVFPAVDHGGELARGPTLLVDALGRDHLLHQPELVVGAEDREIGAQVDQLGMPPQDLGADGMEGAEPLHAFGDRSDQGCDPLAHFPRGLVGERHRRGCRTAAPCRWRSGGRYGSSARGSCRCRRPPEPEPVPPSPRRRPAAPGSIRTNRTSAAQPPRERER